MKVEDQMAMWTFRSMFGLLWCLIKVNYLSRKQREEVDITITLPMRWL
jgi:hypothetical protein